MNIGSDAFTVVVFDDRDFLLLYFSRVDAC